LEEQVDFDKETGKINKIHVKPKNAVDRIAMEHDIAYTIAKNLADKHKADDKMVAALKKLSFKEKGVLGYVAHTIIKSKRTLGLGEIEKLNNKCLD
jgi:hypothetical protein